MNTENKTSNEFARVLYFYYLYQRSKLVDTDLLRIIKKYGTKPKLLINDLTKKYDRFIIPEFVYYTDLDRICIIHSIPNEYISYLQYPIQPYDSRIDVYSSSFDADHVLSSTLSISHIKAVPLDNLSRYLLPNENRKLVQYVKSSSLETDSITENVELKTKEASTHLFDVIALSSIKDRFNSSSSIDSPMVLLYKCMNERIRVRIIIRRNNSIRGSLEAYIRAFDMHFNMLLSDVDEEYITNKQRNKSMIMGSFRNKRNVYKRFSSYYIYLYY